MSHLTEIFSCQFFTFYKNFTKSLVISIASACTHSAARRVVGIIMNHRQTAVTAPMPNTEKVRSTNVIILVHLFNSVLDVSTFGKILETCFLCVKIEIGMECDVCAVLNDFHAACKGLKKCEYIKRLHFLHQST